MAASLRHWTWAVVALICLGVAGFVWLYRDEPPRREESAPQANAAPAGKRILEAQARYPRRRSMDPAQFKDPEVRKSYEVARDYPELLEKLACYCGCFGEGHTSNLDCFLDNHGVT